MINNIVSLIWLGLFVGLIVSIIAVPPCKDGYVKIVSILTPPVCVLGYIPK